MSSTTPTTTTTRDPVERLRLAQARLDVWFDEIWRVAAVLGQPRLLLMLGLLSTDAPVWLSSDPQCTTARLRYDLNRDAFEIELSPSFILEELDNSGDLLFLLLHEIAHYVWRDLQLVPGSALEATIHNVVTDVMINAWLVGPAFLGLFAPLEALPAKTHVPHEPVSGLLVPYAKGRELVRGAVTGDVAATPTEPDSEQARHPVAEHYFTQVVPPPQVQGREPYEPQAWAHGWAWATHAGEYETASHAEGIARLRPLFEQLPPEQLHAMAQRHGCRGRDNPLPAAAQQRLGELAQRLRGHAEIKRGTSGKQAGGEGDLDEHHVQRVRQAGRRLSRYLIHLLEHDPHCAVSAYDPAASRLMRSDHGSRLQRRALINYRAGLCAAPFGQPEPLGGERHQSVTLYLDVSASMNDALPMLLDVVLRDCDGLLEEPIRAFSTRVDPISLRDLRGGRIRSRGGTSFNCVARDLLGSSRRRAVVITDGHGALRNALCHALRQRGVELVLIFPEQECRTPLDEFAPQPRRFALGLE